MTRISFLNHFPMPVATTPAAYLSRHSRLNKIGLLFFGVPAVVGVILLTYAALVDKVFLPFSWTVTSENQFLLMIDAGSHGTRLHIFQYPMRVQDPNGRRKDLVSIPKEIFQFRTSPGISAMTGTPELAGKKCLGPLVEQAQTQLVKYGVKRDDFAEIPVFLKATAGMRDLNVDARQAIMDSIRAYLQQTPFHTRQDSVRVISGEEEGFFGWMTVNAAYGTLLKPANETIGALDMGGASAQVTFFPLNTSIIEDFYEVYLGGSPIRVYSHSFLGYGWGDSLSRVSARLGVEAALAHIQEKGFRGKESLFSKFALTTDANDTTGSPTPSPTSVTGSSTMPTIIVDAVHPCWPKGHTQEFEMPDFMFPDGRFYIDIDARLMYDYVVALGVSPQSVAFLRGTLRPMGQTSPISPQSVVLDPMMSRVGGSSANFDALDSPPGRPKLRFKIRFAGSSDYDACRARAQALLYQPPCFTHSCSYNGVYEPRLVTSRFMAFGQFAKVQQALGIPANPSLTTMEQAVVDLCSRDTAGYGDLSMKMCWKAIWSLTTLVDGYKIAKDSMSVTFASTVGEGETTQQPGWALGAAIYEANQMPFLSAMGRYRTPFFVSFCTNLALFGVAVAMALQVENLLKIIRFHDPLSYQPLHV